MKKRFLMNGWAYLIICCIAVLLILVTIVEAVVIIKNNLPSNPYIYWLGVLIFIDLCSICFCIYAYFTVTIDEEGIKEYHLSKCLKEFKWADIKCVEVSTYMFKYIFITTDNRSLWAKLNSSSLKDQRFMRFIYSKKIINSIKTYYKNEIIYTKDKKNLHDVI